MNRHITIIWLLVGWLAAGLPAVAQTQAMGDGLKGDYYAGTNFERYLLTRRDAAINFDWHGEPPVDEGPANEFSVRWTGWLVPPTSGHYVLHLSIDDGVRLWVNGRQFLDEWRGQPLGFYEVALDLNAGQAYALRIDYCQYAQQTRAELAWVTPSASKPAASSLRSLLSAATAAPPSAVIPTRYLYSHLPNEPAKPLLPPPSVVVASRRAPARPLGHPARRAVSDSQRVATMAAHLAGGQSVTLRALYFTQGHANLLPTVRASLDTLALALCQRPTLRLEVQGHTDNQGDPTLNRQLSQQRAEAVCQYLATRGVAAERLHPVGFGGSQPVGDNRDLAQRAQNRRVVLRPLP